MQYKWKVRLTYNKKGKQPGMMAEERLLLNDAAKDMEVAAAKSRKDVDIEVINLAEQG